MDANNTWWIPLASFYVLQGLIFFSLLMFKRFRAYYNDRRLSGPFLLRVTINIHLFLSLQIASTTVTVVLFGILVERIGLPFSRLLLGICWIGSTILIWIFFTRDLSKEIVKKSDACF